MAQRHPFTRLVHHSTKNLLACVFGEHFQILDTSTGALLVTKTHLTTTQNTKSNQNPPFIKQIAFQDNGNLLATSGDNKTLNIWDIEGWTLRSERTVSKRIISIAFEKSCSSIATADNTGDVYRFLIDVSTEEQNSIKPILGHVSMVTDMVLSPDNKYVITADRDEHIRVSRYPKGHIIETFCLGHTQFVAKLHIIPWATDLMMSAGGDDYVALWDYAKGRLVQCLDIKNLLSTSTKEVSAESLHDFTIMSIASSSLSRHIAIVIEKYSGVVILDWDDETRQLRYKQTLLLDIDPLDIVYDLCGNIWISTACGHGDESPLMILFLRTEDNQYEKTSKDHSLVKDVNEKGSAFADKPSDLYRTGQLRKVNETRDRKSNNGDNADEQDAGTSTFSLTTDVGTDSRKRAKLNEQFVD
ncbi:1655_t:CDS:2 [Paraglomus brasilianum]|uniref:1655_t:CDS:1 n=1 Tax=Paraglomus brasilianum TaxID=144538 RepID=A0A9N8YWJ3_9GLOM|nr:1655_t:CDS:2 [Paraglomus brasilianum]